MTEIWFNILMITGLFLICSIFALGPRAAIEEWWGWKIAAVFGVPVVGLGLMALAIANYP